jgi:hypothetical protein
MAADFMPSRAACTAKMNGAPARIRSDEGRGAVKRLVNGGAHDLDQRFAKREDVDGHRLSLSGQRAAQRAEQQHPQSISFDRIIT